MSLPLPDPIAAYFRAQNAHDVERHARRLRPGLRRVRDEGRDLAGRDAIRAWIDDTTRKYRPSVTPLDVEQVDGSSVVEGPRVWDVSG